MDPVITAALAGLTAFVTTSTEDLLKALGSVTAEKVRKLFGALTARWSKDPTAAGDLERFADDPRLYAPVIQARLEQLLSSDPEFRAELAQLIDDIGPQLTVVQRMAEARGVTGLEADEFRRGRVSVEQVIEKATDVTGAKFKTIG
jgi:hypothetical protein